MIEQHFEEVFFPRGEAATIHTHAALLAFIAAVAAAVTDGVAAAICAVLAAGIVGLDEDGNFAPVSNHGVWYAVWWVSPHKQGGYW